MKIKKLIKELCKREGLKKQIDIAQITELVGHLADLIKEESDCRNFDIKKLNKKTCNQVCLELYLLGKKRAKKKKR